jgi:hypothetical protein
VRRKILLLTAIVAVTLLVAGQSALAGPVAPFDSHPRGRSYPTWMRIYGRWLLGDESNPLVAGLSGDCGEIRHGVFFLAPPIDVGLEFECRIPRGTPILLSHAGQFAFRSAGETDAELEQLAEDLFVTISNSLTLDGRQLRLKPIDTGAYRIVSEPGSFYDSVIGVGTGPVRTAIRANLVFLRPLSRGDHVIEAEVHFAEGGGDFSATYHIRVTRADDDDD